MVLCSNMIAVKQETDAQKKGLRGIKIVIDCLLYCNSPQRDANIDDCALAEFFNQTICQLIGVKRYNHKGNVETLPPKTIEGKKDGFTRWTLHSIVKMISHRKILGNLLLFNTNKFETSNKINKRAIHHKQFVISDHQAIMSNAVFRYICTFLLEGGAINADKQMTFHKDGYYKLSAEIKQMKPMNRPDWAGLSPYIDLKNNKRSIQVEGGHYLHKKIEASKRSKYLFFEKVSRQMKQLLSIKRSKNSVYKIDEYESAEIWRSEIELTLRAESVILHKDPSTHQNKFFFVNAIGRISSKLTEVDIAVISSTRAVEANSHCTVIEPEDEYDVITIDSIKCILFSHHWCREECVVSEEQKVMECITEYPKYVVSWWLGKQIGGSISNPLNKKYANYVNGNFE